jgi:hypothetical protein
MTRRPEPPGQVAARKQAQRERSKAAGMVRFDRWVTPQQDAALKKMLDEWEKRE